MKDRLVLAIERIRAALQAVVKSGVDNVIELVGSACDTFKSGSSTLTAEFPCGAIVVE